MSTAASTVTRAVSTAFGLVMVASAAVQADGPGLVAAVVAAAAVLAGSVFRPAATVAVLLTVAAIVLADAPPVLTATSGLCAAAYLVLRHTARGDLADSAWRRWVYRGGAGGRIASVPAAVGAAAGPAGRVGALRSGHSPVLGDVVVPGYSSCRCHHTYGGVCGYPSGESSHSS